MHLEGQCPCKKKVKQPAVFELADNRYLIKRLLNFIYCAGTLVSWHTNNDETTRPGDALDLGY